MTRITARESLNNVIEAVDTRQKYLRKRSHSTPVVLHAVNEHYENIFNKVATTQIVIQRFPGLHLSFMKTL